MEVYPCSAPIYFNFRGYRYNNSFWRGADYRANDEEIIASMYHNIENKRRELLADCYETSSLRFWISQCYVQYYYLREKNVPLEELFASKKKELEKREIAEKKSQVGHAIWWQERIRRDEEWFREQISRKH